MPKGDHPWCVTCPHECWECTPEELIDMIEPAGLARREACGLPYKGADAAVSDETRERLHQIGVERRLKADEERAERLAREERHAVFVGNDLFDASMFEVAE